MSRAVPADSVDFHRCYRTVGHVLGLGQLAEGTAVIIPRHKFGKGLIIPSWESQTKSPNRSIPKLLYISEQKCDFL